MPTEVREWSGARGTIRLDASQGGELIKRDVDQHLRATVLDEGAAVDDALGILQVAKKDLVPIATASFDAVLGEKPNQKDLLREDVDVKAADLIAIDSLEAKPTYAGLVNAVQVGIRYIEAWLRGRPVRDVASLATLDAADGYGEIRDGAHNPGGVRWLVDHLPPADYTVVASILKALSPHFADYAIYNTDDSDLLIVASVEKKKISALLFYHDNSNTGRVLEKAP